VPRPSLRLLTALLGLLAFAAPRPARAEFKLGVEGQTDFPLDIGARVWAETPLLRIRLGLSVGIMPGFYISTTNTIAAMAGAYDKATADILTTSLTNSLVVRGRIGYRPLAERGLYIDAGYGYIAFGGGSSTSAALMAVSTVPMPQANSGDSRYDVNGKLQMLDLEVGWIWNITNSVTFRLGVGFAFTFSSFQDIKPAFMPKDEAADAEYRNSAQKTLDSHSKIFTPVISLGVGYQLF
jgi:hypothetical protein